MAADDQGEKTEQPTQRRRDEARREGQVAYSMELTGALLLLTGIATMWLFTEFISGNLKGIMRLFLFHSYAAIEYVSFEIVIRRIVSAIITLLGGFMAMTFIITLLGGVFQAGFIITFEAMEPKWNKLDPIKGLGKIFSLQGIVKGLQQILKVLFVAGAAYWVLADRTTTIASLSSVNLGTSVTFVWNTTLELLMAAAVILLILAVGDYVFQKYRHEEQLKMSRTEIKDEQRNEEGDPQVRARRRQIQRELTMKERMIQDVPEATVVITNPTHLAIALKYERDETPAPVCVAKGRGHFARRIVAKAKENGIPVLQRKPLAHALFQTVNVGDEIPPLLYVAVSEILAYLFRLRAQDAA